MFYIRACYPLPSLSFHTTIGPPIPEIQFGHENSRSKVKVEGTPVSTVSCWLICLVFHIRASYRLPSPSFHEVRDKFLIDNPNSETCLSTMKVVVGLCAVLLFRGRPLLTGPWLLNSIGTDSIHYRGPDKNGQIFPIMHNWACVHQQRQNGCFRDGIQRSNRVWICCCSLMKSWLMMFFFTQNLHSSDRTTGESVLLVLGLF